MVREEGRCGGIEIISGSGELGLTGGTVGARVARASTVTLVVVEAKANTDTLVLAGIVTAGIDCG